MNDRTIELTVFCEGPTEARFVDLVLKPHLRAFRVFVKKTAPLNTRNFGTVSWKVMKDAIKTQVGAAPAKQAFTCMIDLYALQNFPAQDVLATSPTDRARSIEEALRNEVASERWIPHIQVHEFEALLFVDLEAFRASFPGDNLDAGISALRRDVTGLAPEAIDDGRETAPSKRLLKHIPAYAKAEVGPAVAERIGLRRLCDACPHFAEWVTKLERLAV